MNKANKVSNGNYLWISYFWSYLNEKGRAGFVMSSQSSSAGHGEKDVRKLAIISGVSAAREYCPSSLLSIAARRRSPSCEDGRFVGVTSFR